MHLVNQQLIKSSNLKRIYNCIYDNSGISRAALSKRTNLSKTTVSSLVDELIEKGFVQDLGTVSDTGAPGRKPNSLIPCSGRYYVIVLLWGEYYIDAHLTDISGVTTPFHRVEAKEPHSYVTGSRKCVDQILKQYHLKREQILGVCIVVPAMIDMAAEKICSTPLHFSRYEEIDLIEELRKSFAGFQTAVLNDTACFAYAEKTCTRLEEPDFAFINFDRGIGAALFIHREMLGRASASYTQFGHYCVDPEGPLCECGNRGCLELTISEEALSRQYLRVNETADHPYSASYRDLGYAAAIDDKAAQTVLKDAAKTFALALSNLVCLIHPRLIILGGQGRELGDFFLNELKSNLKQTGFRYMMDSVELRYSLLDSSACFVGAMKYFFDVHYCFSRNSDDSFHLG